MTDDELVEDGFAEGIDDQLAESEAQFGWELRAMLAEVLVVPEGLTSRMAADVGAALLTRSMPAIAVDLLGLGWHTLRYLTGSTEREVRP
ncbi:MAG: hypothetical protein IT195_02285 [Microthrixaceae bacterium]|nr:hypothetical protein [Microthrixaceae bacterium]